MDMVSKGLELLLFGVLPLNGIEEADVATAAAATDDVPVDEPLPNWTTWLMAAERVWLRRAVINEVGLSSATPFSFSSAQLLGPLL